MVLYYFLCYINALELQAWNKVSLCLCHINTGVCTSGDCKIGDKSQEVESCARELSWVPQNNHRACQESRKK